MDIWIFIVCSLLLVWIIFYRFYAERWNAAAGKIASKGWRNTVKAFLKLSYVISLIAVAVIFVFRVTSLFSGRSGKT